MQPARAFRFTTAVQPGGRVELSVPLPEGSPVEVVVLAQPADEFRDMLDAATSSMGFWDNPEDDAEWNRVPPG